MYPNPPERSSYVIPSAVGSLQPSGQQPEELQLEGSIAGSAFPRAMTLFARAQVFVTAVGAVEGGGPLAHDSASSLARVTQVANRSPSSRSSWNRFRTRST